MVLWGDGLLIGDLVLWADVALWTDTAISGDADQPPPGEVGGSTLRRTSESMAELTWDEQADATAYNIYAGDPGYMRLVGQADLRTDPSTVALCDPVTFSAGVGRVGSDVDLDTLPQQAYLLITAQSPAGEGPLGTGSEGRQRDVDAAACP
jgi:hypothetical protein